MMGELPAGRKPLDNEWFAKHLDALDCEMSQMLKTRDFPNNTCPASRHVQIMTEALAKVGSYPMLQEDPKHCATSMASVLSNLYAARSFLAQLGYTWEIDDNGNTKWIPKNNY